MAILPSLDQHPVIDFPDCEIHNCFDPAPIPDTPGAKAITAIIEADREWLQAEPRSSLSIILKLFPGELSRMSDASEVIGWLAGYLWDAGYTPRNSETYNPTWHWLEGRA
jgi:hypothetical protein